MMGLGGSPKIRVECFSCSFYKAHEQQLEGQWES